MHNAKVRGVADIGTRGIVIDVECHISNGLPNIVIVGFANKAVDEAKERLRGAFVSAGLDMPRKRLTLNLAPADIPKDSTGFDLAMATAILAASKQIPSNNLGRAAFIGELGLDGSIRPVRGIIGKLLTGRDSGIKTFYVPYANLEQALLVPKITVVPVEQLRDIYLYFSQGVASALKPIDTHEGVQPKAVATESSSTFSDIIGQALAKRALEIVAAGGHNILMNGPPGTGKSMLAKALPSILPPLTHEETLEVTHLHSLNDKDYGRIITERPFRAPHHSASDTAITGGGQTPRPGEISLSHRGVLFLDEFPEFSRTSIEALRQPLEDKTITVSRAKESINYPANFILVATANPCPCGYYGTNKPCNCLPHQITRYQRKISGPIIDRVDLYVAVEEVAHSRLLSTPPDAEKIEKLTRQRVVKARTLQQQRFKSSQKLNSDMNNRDIKSLAQLSAEAQKMLNQAARQLEVSARSYMRTIKVARTIADLDGSASIESHHIAEALQYRSQHYQLQT